MSLEERLAEARRRAREKLPPEMCDALDRMVAHLDRTALTAGSIKAGERIPDFELPDSDGRLVFSQALRQRGPLVVSFFRGDFCPYCTLELQALEEALPEIEQLGATLVAITPDTGAALASDKRRQRLHYRVLSDADSGLALLFGLVFRLPEAVRDSYLRLGLDLRARHGNDAWFLPIPATYVVDRNGIVRHAELDPDFTRRMEPAAIIDLLRRLAAEDASGGGAEIARPNQPDEGVERG